MISVYVNSNTCMNKLKITLPVPMKVIMHKLVFIDYKLSRPVSMVLAFCGLVHCSVFLPDIFGAPMDNGITIYTATAYDYWSKLRPRLTMPLRMGTMGVAKMSDVKIINNGSWPDSPEMICDGISAYNLIPLSEFLFSFYKRLFG